MGRAIFLVPIAGMTIAIAVPLANHVNRQRYEETAIDVLQQIRQAQQAFHAQWGGFATDAASLITPCEPPGALDAGLLNRLRDSGYEMALRPASGAVILDRSDCRGKPVASDYYVAVQPIAARAAGHQAFAARAEGDVYIFFDGVAPSELDVANGLATPLRQRSSFRIP